MKKAWTVRRCGDLASVVVYAETRNKAKDMGAGEMECDYIDIARARRTPAFDKYYPGMPPAAVLVANGWALECCGCSATVDYDDGAEFSGDLAWCSKECRDKRRRYSKGVK